MHLVSYMYDDFGWLKRWESIKNIFGVLKMVGKLFLGWVNGPMMSLVWLTKNYISMISCLGW